jgi:hypothetical protein
MTQAATLAQLASSGAITADANGYVGIGTTTPANNLQVISAADWGIGLKLSNNTTTTRPALLTQRSLGTAAAPTTVTINTIIGGFESGGYNGSAYTLGYNGGAAIFACAAETWTPSSNATYLQFCTNSSGAAGWAERMRIDQTGGVRIKTTTNIFNGQINEALTVDNGTNGNAATLSTNATGGFPVLYLRHQVAGSNNQIIFITSSGTAGSITSNGLAVAYNTSSDYRLKENVQPMVGALDKVSQLKPCTYNWKHDGSDGQGFIAHELQAVVPDCVNGEKDAVDADGNPNYQGVDTSFLVATLTAAIQELKAELDVCKAEISALKG